MSGTAITQLRIVGLLEGISFLVLLGVAMPLKYLFGMPGAVSIVGMLHGIFFIIYGVALLNAQLAVRWPARVVVALAAAAVLPLGPFFAEGWLRRQQRQVA